MTCYTDLETECLALPITARDATEFAVGRPPKRNEPVELSDPVTTALIQLHNRTINMSGPWNRIAGNMGFVASKNFT
jgi:hypothetical protein